MQRAVLPLKRKAAARKRAERVVAGKGGLVSAEAVAGLISNRC